MTVALIADTWGAIAFSRSSDPATGDFGCDAKLIRKFGEVPSDLSAL